MSESLAFSELFAELNMRHGIALINVNRPIRALEYLDNAEKIYKNLIELLKGATTPLDDDSLRPLLDSYEYCRAKEAETWLRMSDGIPKGSMKYWISCVQSYLLHSLDYFALNGNEEHYSYYYEVLKQSGSVHVEDTSIDPDFFGKANPERQPEGYEGWCFYGVLFLNPFNEIPNPNEDWMCDDLDLQLDERHSIILEDIIRTFDHCRKILYEFTKAPIEERFFKVRDDSVESLIDCYVRLYSILDKAAKIIEHVFALDLGDNTVSFWNVGEALEASSNKYLRSIASIKSDMFPERLGWKINCVDPHLTFAMAYYRSSFIRNNIIHDTFRIVGPDEKDYVQWNVAAITVRDLEYQTWALMYTVRETLLLTKMAVEYKKNG